MSVRIGAPCAPTSPRPTSSRTPRRFLRVAGVLLTLVIGACAPSGADDTPAAGSSPSRIVSLVPSLNELLVAIGAGDRVVARTDFDTHPALVDLPSVGGGLDPNLERLVELQVEVVLMPEGQEMPALASRLDAVGVRAVGVRTETVEHLHGAIAQLGALAGRQSAADSLSLVISRGMSAVEAHVAGRSAVPVMYVLWGDPPMTVAAGTYVDELLSIAGGTNVFADAPMKWPTVSFESIVDRDPDVLIWPRGVTSEVTLELVRELPGWRDLRAVREGRVAFVDTNLFNRPGPQLPAAAEALARILHPEAFGEGAR